MKIQNIYICKIGTNNTLLSLNEITVKLYFMLMFQLNQEVVSYISRLNPLQTNKLN